MQIENLTLADIVQLAVFPAIADGLRPAVVADVLAQVDWSGYRAASKDVLDLLGQLEAWSTEFAEDDLTAEEYRSRLERLASTGRDIQRAARQAG